MEKEGFKNMLNEGSRMMEGLGSMWRRWVLFIVSKFGMLEGVLFGDPVDE